MPVPARVSFVTLACRDVAAMRRFYDQFGWPPSEHNEDTFAAYQCGGAILGLFGALAVLTRGSGPARLRARVTVPVRASRARRRR